MSLRWLFLLPWLLVWQQQPLPLSSSCFFVHGWMGTANLPKNRTPPGRMSSSTSRTADSATLPDVGQHTGGGVCIDRRSLLLGGAMTSVVAPYLVVAGAAMGLSVPSPALAAASVPTPTELDRLRRGHARVRYLLDHWVDLTQTCKSTALSELERKQVVRTEGGGGGGTTGGCDKTPLVVQEYMGFKSTEDPLYRVEKLLIRAVPLVDDDVGGYLEVVEAYKAKADNTALMAYTSAWGEANPNGGKDVIEEYLERTRLDVVDSERYLRQILGYLGLEPLPPSKDP